MGYKGPIKLYTDCSTLYTLGLGDDRNLYMVSICGVYTLDILTTFLSSIG